MTGHDWDQERKYLLREGHLFGMVMSGLLWRWAVAWLVWFFIVLALWVRSIRKEV